jgi:hypothetical protein
MRKCVIQDTWDDDDDLELLEYFKHKNIPYETLTREQILLENIDDIDVLFCDTDIVQLMISSKFVPSTYPEEFRDLNFQHEAHGDLYHRNIRNIKYKECINQFKPYFIKPYGNNKEFNATIVTDKYDEIYLKSVLNDDDDVYISEKVTFVNEYRLFIANNTVNGMVNSSEFLLESKNIKLIEPPKDFIDIILNVNTHQFCVIDVGLLDTGEWAIVEVNPPFSISSYNWPIKKYYNYCKSFWDYFQQSF